jgi:hypothetical protein
MKYSISQGENARCLTETAGRGGAYDRRLYGVGGETVLYSEGEGRYEAEVPERPMKYMGDVSIYSFASWAGLRPVTCLEYEKACRGPRVVTRDEDAWASGACAPAEGLAQFVPSLAPKEPPANPRLIWPEPSYWGIRDLSQSGAFIEWPAVVKEDGRGFAGNHGTGSPQCPGNWPLYSRCEWYAMGMLQGYPLSEIGHWRLTEDGQAETSSRAGRYGARAVRTAAGSADKDSPLQVEALPNLTGYDLAVANLSGRFRNDGDKPLKAELVSALPAACFLYGGASRVFTAAARAATPFKVPVVLTRAVTNATVRGGRVQLLPIEIKAPGGETLADTTIRLSSDVLTRQHTAVQSLDGGTIELKVKNATENPLTLAFEMPSLPILRFGGNRQSITVAAGGDGVAAFPVPRQWFPQEGLCRIPYRVTIGSGPSAARLPDGGQAPAQAGVAMAAETAVELWTQTRWWIKRHAKTGPKMPAGGEGLLKGAEDLGGIGGEGVVFSDAGDVFTLAAPSKGWKPVTCGAAVTLGQAGPLPSRDSKAIGATRAIAAGDAEAVVVARAVDARGREVSMRPPDKGEIPFFLCVWVNESLVFDSHLAERERAKTARIRKGLNSVVVEWVSNADGESAAESVQVQFNDAKTGKPLPDVLLDMGKK